jgi:hypothetical protein
MAALGFAANFLVDLCLVVSSFVFSYLFLPTKPKYQGLSKGMKTPGHLAVVLTTDTSGETAAEARLKIGRLRKWCTDHDIRLLSVCQAGYSAKELEAAISCTDDPLSAPTEGVIVTDALKIRCLGLEKREKTIRAILDEISDNLEATDTADQAIAGQIYTQGWPHPDLVVVFGPTFRLAGYPPWELKYSEIR